MVNLEQEIKARGRKPAFGPMSSTRNRRILAQAVEDEDRATTEVFKVKQFGYSIVIWRGLLVARSFRTVYNLWGEG